MNKLFQQAVAESGSTLPRQRSAALVLHGMSEADRAWALAQLSDEERDVLRPLIDELQALGVPADADWVASALGGGAPADGADASQPLYRQVARARAGQVVGVLQEEPVELIRRLLGMSAWPWKAEVIAALNARRGVLFDTAPALAPVGAATALDRALLARLAEQLDRMGEQSSGDAGHRPSPAPGWLGWLRARGVLR